MTNAIPKITVTNKITGLCIDFPLFPARTGLTEEEQLKGMLATGVGENAKGLEGNVLVDVSEEGVRIQITDNKEQPIFPVQSPAGLTYTHLPGRRQILAESLSDE